MLKPKVMGNGVNLPTWSIWEWMLICVRVTAKAWEHSADDLDWSSLNLEHDSPKFMDPLDHYHHYHHIHHYQYQYQYQYHNCY